MISYGNPICPVTEEQSHTFVLLGELHATRLCVLAGLPFGGPRQLPYGQMEQSGGGREEADELPLSKEELMLLEKQEKQLKIIQEELSIIQTTTKE
jgi:hypothetical protein